MLIDETLFQTTLSALPPSPRWWLDAHEHADQYLVHLRSTGSGEALDSLLRALRGPHSPLRSSQESQGEDASPSFLSTATVATAATTEGSVAGFIPASSYLVVATPAALARVEKLPAVTWTRLMRPAHKVAPDVAPLLEGSCIDRATEEDCHNNLLPDLVVHLPPVEGVNATAAADDARTVLRIVFKSVAAAAADAALATAADAAAGSSTVAVPSTDKIIITLAVDPSSLPVTANHKGSLLGTIVAALSSRPWAHWIELRTREANTFNMQTSAVIQTGRGVGLGSSSRGVDVAGGNAQTGASWGGHPLWSVGLTGDGQLVGAGDSGLDLDSCWLRDPVGIPPGPNHRKVHAYNRVFGDEVDGNGHGTHVVSSILGDASVDKGGDDLEAARAYNGMAPGARVVFTDIGKGRGGVLYLPTSMERYYGYAYDAGSRLHSDSWGNDVPVYDGLAREVDEFVWRHRDFLPIFAAGNFGAVVHASSTVTSPSTCKNGISVGASLGWSGPNVPSQRVGDSFDMAVLAPEEQGGDFAGDVSARGEIGRLRIYMAAMGPPMMPFSGGKIDDNNAVNNVRKQGLVLVEATPEDACAPLVAPPAGVNDSGSGGNFYTGKIVLVTRGKCYFTDKIRAAQVAGAAGVVVANNDITGFFKMAQHRDVTYDDTDVMIPSGSMPLSSASKLRALLDALADMRMKQRVRQSDRAGRENFKQELASLRHVSVSFTPALVSDQRVDHIASFSSFGPTEDGRIKPDVVAPGEITSASGKAVYEDGSSGACSVIHTSGTSMATPIVAGAAALVRQYFVDGYYPTGTRRESDGFSPSAALMKAVLINGAQPMNGFTEAGLPLEPPPSVRQGHGRVHVGRSLPIVQDAAARGDESGDESDGSGGGAIMMFAVDDVPIGQEETHEYCLSVIPPAAVDKAESEARELRVTLVWTDPPAVLPSAGPALVNDLDLKVRAQATLEDVPTREDPAWLTLESNEWAPKDRRNNVERVTILIVAAGEDEAAVPRRYVVSVTGHRVRWVPTNDPRRGQPYSLVATGPDLARCESDSVHQQQKDGEEKDERRGAGEVDNYEDSMRYAKPTPSPTQGRAPSNPPRQSPPDEENVHGVEDDDPSPQSQPRPRGRGSSERCRWWEYLDPRCW